MMSDVVFMFAFLLFFLPSPVSAERRYLCPIDMEAAESVNIIHDDQRNMQILGRRYFWKSTVDLIHVPKPAYKL